MDISKCLSVLFKLKKGCVRDSSIQVFNFIGNKITAYIPLFFYPNTQNSAKSALITCKKIKVSLQICSKKNKKKTQLQKII